MAGKMITGDPGKTSTPVYDYLRTLVTENTRRGYAHALDIFLQQHLPDAPDTEARARLYLADGRDPFSDLVDFINAHRTLAPKTLQAQRAAVVGWLDYHDRSIPDKRKKIISRMVRGGARTQDISPTRDQLKTILMYGSPLTRIAVLVMASSGIRIGELIQLKWSDLAGDLAADRPLGIRIRAEITKTKTRRLTYCSSEAADALLLWRENHPAFCKSIRKHTTTKDYTIDAERIIPLTQQSVQDAFQRAITRAGLNERDASTHRHLLHPHSLRKYIRNTLSKADATDARDYVDTLIGHESQLDRAYRRMDPDEVRDFYAAWEHLLWIERPVQIATKELKTVQRENVEMQQKMSALEGDIAYLRSLIEKIQIAEAAIEDEKPKRKKK